VVDRIALRRAGTADRAKYKAQAPHTRTPVVPATIQSKPWQLKVVGVNRRAARRTRLAANAGPWAGWPGSNQQSAPHIVSIKIVSDIIILGQGN
jgi:hypothetical protein